MSGDRLYRRTDPPLPIDKPKSKYTSKKAQTQRRKARSSKRRRVSAAVEEEDSEAVEADETLDETVLEDTMVVNSEKEIDPETVKTFGEYKWECIAVTYAEYTEFMAQLSKSKDQNEINLRSFVHTEVLAALEAQEERRKRKLEAQLREIQLAEKMQGAKRSGRLAAKQEREREEAEAAEAERKLQAARAEARMEQERAEKMDHERQSRMMTREQRIKEREMKRLLMEDQLARDAEEAQRADEIGARNSRHLKERIEKHKQQLEEFDDDEWTFDCSGCHQFGKNFDDGEHSIACERCNVWQHSKCLGFSKSAAESDDFHFVCKDCRRKEEEAKRPRISLKFKVGQSSSPPQPEAAANSFDRASPISATQRIVSVDIPPLNPGSRPAAQSVFANGQSISAAAHSSVPDQASQPKFLPQQQPSLPQFPPHERLPGTNHAQNLYQQITNQHNVISPPLQNQSYATPSLPPYQLPRPSSSHIQTVRPHSSHALMKSSSPTDSSKIL